MINYFKVEGIEIAPLVEEIEEICEGKDRSYVALACTIVAIMAQNPDITSDTLGALVTKISELISAIAFETETVN